MKKLIGIVLLMLVAIVLVGCGTKDTEWKYTDFRHTYNEGINYEPSLRNHDWVEVDSYDGSKTFKCVDIISITVHDSGVLEIIDDDGDVYLICDSWQIEFYDYYVVADNG